VGHPAGGAPLCHNSHYWQVFFDTNRAIGEVGAKAAFDVPEQRFAVRSLGELIGLPAGAVDTGQSVKTGA
jgi:hypothetical protein